MNPLSQSYFSGASSTQIIYQTIGDYLDHICERFPDNEALVVRHQNVRWTYARFKREIDRLATGLLAGPTASSGRWCNTPLPGSGPSWCASTRPTGCMNSNTP
jgi:fatty-acyl-CoA synthase